MTVKLSFKQVEKYRVEISIEVEFINIYIQNMMVRSLMNMKVWRNRYERKFNDSCFYYRIVFVYYNILVKTL